MYAPADWLLSQMTSTYWSARSAFLISCNSLNIRAADPRAKKIEICQITSLKTVKLSFRILFQDKQQHVKLSGQGEALFDT